MSPLYCILGWLDIFVVLFTWAAGVGDVAIFNIETDVIEVHIVPHTGISVVEVVFHAMQSNEKTQVWEEDIQDPPHQSASVGEQQQGYLTCVKWTEKHQI